MTDIRHPDPSNPFESTLARIKHLDISDRLSYDKNARIISGGSYGDIRIGTYEHPDRGKVKVAMKCLRVFLAQDPENMKVIKTEVRAWSKLNHPNILPLLGYIFDENDLPVLVAEFMENGTALQYIMLHPEEDIINIILGIAEGIGYLHSRGIVHSDLKSDNILISKDGNPLICDFGISRMISTLSTTFSGFNMHAHSSSGAAKGSARWMAPEILCPSDEQYPGKHTIESDTWAFGMVAYELLCRQRPYHECKNDVQVISAIGRGQLPERPGEYYSWSWNCRAVWYLCEACWSKTPGDRPGMSVIIWLLKASHADTFSIVKLSDISKIPCPKCFMLGTLSCNCIAITETLIGHNKQNALTPELDNANSSGINTSTKSTTERDKQNERMQDLDESVNDCRNQLAAYPPGDPYWTESLVNLVFALCNRFKETGQMDDSWEAIRLLREALPLFPEEGLDRMEILKNIALCYHARFEENGETNDIQHAVMHYRQTLSLCPEDHPDRGQLLGQAGYYLTELSDRTKRNRDIEEAISMNRVNLIHYPKGHPGRPAVLNNLSSNLLQRFRKLKKDEDIDETVTLCREALTLRPVGHRERDGALCNLGYKLYLRYESHSRPADIEEAIHLYRAALSLRPEGHQYRPVTLTSLADCLDARFRCLRDTEDCVEAAALRQAAESLERSEVN